MGSTGTGSFTDYSNHRPNNPSDETGGSSGSDKCSRAFTTNLEDVGRSRFFNIHNNVPPIGTTVIIQAENRIIACTIDGIEIGYLPTKYNYLKLCIDDGYTYKGRISTSSNIPLPFVTIDIAPN